MKFIIIQLTDGGADIIEDQSTVRVILNEYKSKKVNDFLECSKVGDYTEYPNGWIFCVVE